MTITHIAGPCDNMVVTAEFPLEGYEIIQGWPDEDSKDLFAVPIGSSSVEKTSSCRVANRAVDEGGAQLIIMNAYKRAMRELIREWADPRTFRLSQGVDGDDITFRCRGLVIRTPGMEGARDEEAASEDAQEDSPES